MNGYGYVIKTNENELSNGLLKQIKLVLKLLKILQPYCKKYDSMDSFYVFFLEIKTLGF